MRSNRMVLYWRASDRARYDNRILLYARVAVRRRSSSQVLERKNWTASSLAGRRLYVRNHQELICLDVTG